MKVIAGSCRGMTIHSPLGEQTRPTGAKAREAIMQMLADRLDGALFVDIFAGSGAMGIEALSRGCRRCYFVEQSSHAIQAIEKNLGELGRRLQVQNLSDQQWVVVRQKAERAMRYLIREIREFSGGEAIFYADPPYGAEMVRWLEGFLTVLAQEALGKSTTLVIESAAQEAPEIEQLFVAHRDRWTCEKIRRYGQAVVHMYTSP